MFEFLCPTCGKRVQGDDSVAGKRVVCPGCNIAMTVPGASSPGAANAIATPAHASQARVSTHATSNDGAFSEGPPPRELPMPSVKKAGTFVPTGVGILVILAVIAILVALLVPATERVHEAAARTQSVNNLKQIAVAALSFHDMHKQLPFNGVVDARANDPASGSWLFQILPFIDHEALFANPNPVSAVQPYMCPGRGRSPMSTTGAWSDYALNPWLNDDKNGAVDAPDVRRTLVDITDGSSNTIFAGHGTVDKNLYASNVAHAQSTDIFKGGHAALARRVTVNIRDNDDGALNWGGPFPQGALFAWCDATIRMVPYSMTGGVIVNGVSTLPNPPQPPVLGWQTGGFGAYLTPRGGEAVVLPD